MADFDERFAPLADMAQLSNDERMRNYLLANMQAQNYNAGQGKSLAELSYDPMTGIPIGIDATRKRPNWFMEPDLQGYQTGELPPGVARNEHGFYDPETGGPMTMVRRPGVLPIAKTPEGYTFATPKLADLASYIVGGAVPVQGGEMVLGAGATRAKRSTEIPAIRELPVDEAVAIARTEPHLIKAGEQSEGYYVGGPRDIGSRRALTKARNAFDEYVAADPRGGDWYDRYRAAVNQVTGGDPVKNRWMTSQEGQWSAGVDPGSELGFALKENNAAIAGMPVKAARPAQHEAHLAAIEAQNPSLYQLGEKTGEYQRLISPDQPLPPGATGVNDFRHARNWGYTEASGEAQRNALTAASHKFLDYETALAVDRANRANLGGRSNWTGEQLQAAPWVRQKALDIQARGGTNADGTPKLSYDEAFARANRTIGDYFDKHTAFATHEAIPGADVVGHMPGAVTASAAERAAYSADPLSTWANAPGGRDAIYAGMGIPGTGVSVRTRPSLEMQGMYTTPGGSVEFNPGWTARPLVAFETGKVKTVAPADQALLNAGEATRGYIDAQNAAAWHKPWVGGAAGESQSLFFPRETRASPLELMAIQAKTAQHGLPDVVDTGQGVTATRFWPPPEGDIGKAVRKREFKEFGTPSQAKIDSNLIDYVDAWKKGEGSGAATQQLLEHVSQTPQLREAMNSNADIARNAMLRLTRDEAWAAKWGAPRADIQNARRIIGEGPGWIDRLEEALKKGAIALPAVAAIVGASALNYSGRDKS